MFLKENIFKQVSILIASISLLVLVIAAADETGRGDIRTLTALAETNSEVMEVLEESSAEVKETQEEITEQQTLNSQPGEQSEARAQDGIQVGEQEKQNSLKEKLMLNEKIVEENKKIEAEEKSQTTAVAQETTEAQKTAATVVPCSQEDYQILLRIVQAEAGICDDTGKVLVANVILNRVRDEEFPDTIKEVVYQKSQFSPVANGAINTCKVTQQTVDCVNRALMGEDYSQGALYFMNRRGAQSGAADWFDGRLTFLFQHERHEFFK